MNEKREFDGDIPLINVSGNSMPEAWENSLLALNNHGLWYSREGEKDKGERQVDSTMAITIKNPTSDLFLHKYWMGDPADVVEYMFEFLGAKDSLVIDHFDPKDDTRWNYTYPRRFFRYNEGLGEVVDQVAEVIEKLASEPHRRNSQIITWQPKSDLHHKDPPCAQRFWFFPVPMQDNSYRLNMNASFRSRNAMIAAHQNWAGEMTFQNYVANKVEERIQEIRKQTNLPLDQRTKVVPGRLVDISDSYHVSSSNQKYLNDFVKTYERSIARGETIADRSYTKEDVYSQMREQVDSGKMQAKISDMLKQRFDERAEGQKAYVESIGNWMQNFLKK